MRAGRPMLFVPYGWDQPDNGKRIQRLGAGVSLSRKEYLPAVAYPALKRLLSDARFAERSAEVGKRVQQEDGLTAACNAIEAIL